MNYNQRNYNAQRYNINGVFYVSSFSETIAEMDGTQIADLLKSLSDSLASTDALVSLSDIGLLDFTFMDDMIQIQFTNKALFDTIRLADWLSIERIHTNIGWGD